MARSAKQKGKHRELWLQDKYTRMGFYTILSAGSHGVFDLMAMSSQGGQLIQVKSNRLPPASEMKQIADFRQFPENFTKVIAVIYDPGTLAIDDKKHMLVKFFYIEYNAESMLKTRLQRFDTLKNRFVSVEKA